MKDFHCRDAGMNCDYVAKGSTKEEVLKDAGNHAQQAHNMKLSPEMSQRVEGLIHDENSEAHKRSMSSSQP
jgi:predicted small metal-binding protein